MSAQGMSANGAAAPRTIDAQGGLDAEGSRRLTGRTAVDLAVLAGLALIAVLGFGAAYRGWGFLLAAAGGLLVGGGAALLAHRLRLNLLNTVLIAIAAYFLLGTGFAMPGTGFLGVLPTLQTLWALAVGAVDSWRDAVTLAAPIESPAHMGALPYLATALSILASWLIALRWLPRRPGSGASAAVAVVPPALLFLLSLVIGTHEPFWGVARGIAFALLALVWLGWRRGVDSVASADAKAGLRRRRLVGTAAVAAAAVAVTGAGGWLATPALDASRLVVRDEVTPPFDPYPYESPLAGFREYTKLLRETTLFTVSGLSQGDRLRIAALDEYTGMRWQTASPELAGPDSGSYTLIGRDLAQPQLLTASSTRSLEVYVNGYDDIWLPTIGSPTSLDLSGGSLSSRRSELRFNEQAGAGMLIDGLREGDSYRVEAAIQDAPLEGQLDDVPVAPLQLPPSQPAPAALVEKMQTFTAGESSPYLQLRAIEEALKAQGYLSHGTASDQAPSRAGHGLDRMQELFGLTYMIGDEEQYAAAMALMARELGYPSRVVVGFAPSVPNAGAAVEVRGEDITAWVEVPFEGFGWVAFDPTPEQTDAPVNTAVQPQTKPRAQVRQPPQTEAQPDDLVTAADRPGEDDREKPEQFPVWAIIAIAAVGIPLLLLLVPLGVFALLRWLRRRRRDRGSPDARIAGAWDEAVDRMAELGYAVPERETRPVMARALHPELAPVALAADRAVFGGGEPDEQAVRAVWEDAERIVRQAGLDASPWRRLLARFRAGGRGGDAARRARERREGAMTAERAELRNRIIRSRGADMPDLDQLARVEGIEVSPEARAIAEAERVETTSIAVVRDGGAGAVAGAAERAQSAAPAAAAEPSAAVPASAEPEGEERR